MIAFRRLLARRAPALRFYSWGEYDMCDTPYLSESQFYHFQASTIEDQIKEIKKKEAKLGALINIFQSEIRDKSNDVQKVLRNTKKEPFKSLTPDVKTMLEASEAWAGLKDVPDTSDLRSKTLDDVTKILKALETWHILKKNLEDYPTLMRDLEGDLTLLASVRIMRTWVSDVKKQLGKRQRMKKWGLTSERPV